MANLKGSENPFPHVLLEEVATDGSDTGTPAADFRHLFLGEDGALHLKDSAAAVTDVGGDAAAHIADATDAHDASAISIADAGTYFTGTDVEAALQELGAGGGGGAPTTVDYLVGTADGGLSNEIVVGTTPGGELGGTWASPTVDATHAGSTHALGRIQHAAPMHATFGAPTTSEDLASNGGTLALPIYVPATMNLVLLALHNRNTASARTAEWRLYRHGGSTLDFVTGCDGTFSFTPTAASDRTSAPSGAPVVLSPGGYVVAIRNTSVSQNFSVGYVAAAGTFWNQYTLSFVQTLGSALGATLTTSGWSTGARHYGVQLIGSSFGA